MMQNLKQSLDDHSMQAFLHMIRACEGTLTDAGYAALYGWRPVGPMRTRVITDFRNHPRKRFWIDGRAIPAGVKPKPYSYTTAAGAYQATETTWDRFIKECGPHDFTPHNQDLFAVWCINKAKVLDDVLKGYDAAIVIAITACSPTWASLPFNKAKQPHRTLKFCLDAYHAAGEES